MYYINSYGHEIHPSPNPDYIKSLARNEVLVYSCGSLWTRYVRGILISALILGTSSENCNSSNNKFKYHPVPCTSWSVHWYCTLAFTTCQGPFSYVQQLLSRLLNTLLTPHHSQLEERPRDNGVHGCRLHTVRCLAYSLMAYHP